MVHLSRGEWGSDNWCARGEGSAGPLFYGLGLSGKRSGSGLWTGDGEGHRQYGYCRDGATDEDTDGDIAGLLVVCSGNEAARAADHGLH